MKTTQIGDYIAWRGQRGVLRGRIEMVRESTDSGEQTDPLLTIQMYKRGEPTEHRRTLKQSDMTDLRVGENTVQPQVLFTMVSEIGSASAPDIPLPPRVSIEKLTVALGRPPKFVTLPIGEVGITSRNENSYGRRSVERLVAQVNSKLPEGRWGHLSFFELGSRYDPPGVRWLAATLDSNGIAWAKLVALTLDAEQHFTAAEAVGAKVGTSIFGLDPVEKDGEIIDYRLITIDLANAEMVGVPRAAAKPIISSEMSTPDAPGEDEDPTPSIPEQEKEANMPTDVRIEELVAERTRLQEQVTVLERENRTLKAGAEDLSAIRELFGFDADSDILKSLRAQKDLLEEMQSENGDLLKDAMKALIDDKVVIESVRPIAMQLVQAKNPVTRKQLDRAIDDVLALESMKTLLAAKVIEESGPAVKPPVNPPAKNNDDWKQFVDIPDKEAV